MPPRVAETQGEPFVMTEARSAIVSEIGLVSAQAQSLAHLMNNTEAVDSLVAIPARDMLTSLLADLTDRLFDLSQDLAEAEVVEIKECS